MNFRIERMSIPVPVLDLRGVKTLSVNGCIAAAAIVVLCLPGQSETIVAAAAAAAIVSSLNFLGRFFVTTSVAGRTADDLRADEESVDRPHTSIRSMLPVQVNQPYAHPAKPTEPCQYQPQPQPYKRDFLEIRETLHPTGNA